MFLSLNFPCNKINYTFYDQENKKHLENHFDNSGNINGSDGLRNYPKLDNTSFLGHGHCLFLVCIGKSLTPKDQFPC